MVAGVDQALYVAKKKERNRVEVAGPEEVELEHEQMAG
jgi:hypothetical protein